MPPPPAMANSTGSIILPLRSLANCTNAVPVWRRLLKHLTLLALSRARLSVGSRMLISNAMMPMTTKSSTSVKPAARLRVGGAATGWW